MRQRWRFERSPVSAVHTSAQPAGAAPPLTTPYLLCKLRDGRLDAPAVAAVPRLAEEAVGCVGKVVAGQHPTRPQLRPPSPAVGKHVPILVARVDVDEVELTVAEGVNGRFGELAPHDGVRPP